MGRSAAGWLMVLVLGAATLLLALIGFGPLRAASPETPGFAGVAVSAGASDHVKDEGGIAGDDSASRAATATSWDGEREPVSSESPEPRVNFRSDKISIQTATQRVCEQAGFHYDWSRSYGNTQPDCRRYIRVDVTAVPLSDALDAIVSKNGLRYCIEGKNVWLER